METMERVLQLLRSNTSDGIELKGKVIVKQASAEKFYVL